MQIEKIIPLFLLLTAATIESCKKGTDDPVISFRTRKNRVVGEWKLEKGTYRHNVIAPGMNPIAESVDFNSYQYIYIVDIPGTIYTAGYKGPYSRSFDFNKNGTVSIIESIDNFLYSIKGTWDFNSGIGSEKNKEQIIIHFQSYTTSGGTRTFTGNQKDMTFSITELRNKKMVLYSKQAETDVDGDKEEVVETIELKQ